MMLQPNPGRKHNSATKLVLIINGPPGAGKSSTAAAVTDAVDSASLVEVDDLRDRPRSGPSMSAFEADARTACRTIKSQLYHADVVVVTDILTQNILDTYRTHLDCRIGTVTVLPSLETCLKRLQGRRSRLEPQRVATVHALVVSQPFGVVLDDELLSPAENAQVIVKRLGL